MYNEPKDVEFGDPELMRLTEGRSGADQMREDSLEAPNRFETQTDFVPTRDELIHLVKYWVKEAIDDEYFIFWGQCFGVSDLRRIHLDWQRVNEIAQILGEAETDKAVKKAYEETAQDFKQSDWILFRYGTREERSSYQDNGGQSLSDFEPGVAEEIACKVVQRVFRDGAPDQQQALIKDELARYGRKFRGYKRGPQHVVEIFGIYFPAELRRLITSVGVADPDPQPNGFFGTLSIEQGKALLAMLDETAKKGEGALKALVTGDEGRTQK
jgi:hypothetical protein